MNVIYMKAYDAMLYVFICIAVNSVVFPWDGRCVCPYGTHGSRCKVLSRQFRGSASANAWAWLAPLNPCSKLDLSLSFLTNTLEGVLLSTQSPGSKKRSGLSLRLVNGTPHFQMTLEDTSVSLTTNTSVSDGRWHLIDIHWKRKVGLVINILRTFLYFIEQSGPSGAVD